MGVDQIPTDLILSEDSIQAGLAAMQQIHGRHLSQMTAEEQNEARAHWRSQVEQVLAAVRDTHASPPTGGGRALLTFNDVGDDQIDVGVAFEPELREVGDEVEGTPAQLLALAALEAIADDEDEVGT